MITCSSTAIARFEFSPEEIAEAIRSKRLLSMELELSLRCNLRCPYCYVSSKEAHENELSADEIRGVITQAKDLGARKIIVLGGEPLMHPQVFEHISFIREQGMGVELFTNGYYIDENIAKALFALGVNVVLKMNTFNEELQDKLTGFRGAQKFMLRALECLKKAGYPSQGAFLAVSTVICRDNIEELVGMWQWLRDQHILPYFEIITPQGSFRNNDWLMPDMQRIKKLFSDIAELDKTRYGIAWDPQPPLVGGRCLRHTFSCLISAQGQVLPCVGVTIPVGDIRSRPLKDILADSEVIQDLRDHQLTIKGPCRSCEKSQECYGCRGAAYQLTGDYLASDPLCWKNSGRESEITKLPANVTEIIPHRRPMAVVDTLEKVGERSATITTLITADMPFVDEHGLLDDAGYLEIIAQASAAMGGFKQLGASNKKPRGFLLGCRKLQVLGTARVGDVLEISLFKEARYGDFGIIKGNILCNGHLLASGEIKIVHNLAQEENRI